MARGLRYYVLLPLMFVGLILIVLGAGLWYVVSTFVAVFRNASDTQRELLDRYARPLSRMRPLRLVCPLLSRSTTGMETV
jgi:hypothetical protein